MAQCRLGGPQVGAECADGDDVAKTETRVRPVAARDTADALRRLLTDADDEFVPPLSARGSTLESLLGPEQERAAGIDDYLAAVLEQQVLVAQDASGVVGFLSYRPGHVVTIDGHEPVGPAAYVTTIVVAPTARRRGLARALYEALLDEVGGGAVATRTWSGNASHLTLLAHLGFVEAIRLPDDRGPGVDTVYLIRAADAR